MKRYLVGVEPACGCITAGMVWDATTSVKDLSDFMATMINTGREFRPQDEQPTIQVCSHAPHRVAQ